MDNDELSEEEAEALIQEAEYIMNQPDESDEDDDILDAPTLINSVKSLLEDKMFELDILSQMASEYEWMHSFLSENDSIRKMFADYIEEKQKNETED